MKNSNLHINHLADQNNKKRILIDVREPDEYWAEHVPNSVNIPLSQMEQKICDLINQNQCDSIMFLCKSGTRSKMAVEQIKKLNLGNDICCSIYEGGLTKWKQQGGETLKRKSFHLPIMQQVQILLGILIITFGFLAIFVSSNFIWVLVFFGFSLTIAGLTGFCGMAKLLSIMPWNKTSSTHKTQK